MVWTDRKEMNMEEEEDKFKWQKLCVCVGRAPFLADYKDLLPCQW